ncbi:IclR family transcriptional regulator [Aeromicrobium sp. CTD01-1L150]|uniref:IclR family transcriptional regulator n=1 Tax=Aeromicrobium sp. CTD01-1L150 TaxID=3341830 RepID=UPI0035C24C18
MRSDDGKGVVDRVVEILETFNHEDRLNASQVSRLSQIPLSTCHRILTALTGAGLLERHGRDYHVGLRLWEIASHAPRSVGIQRLALPFMHDLLEVTDSPVHLAVRDGLDALFIERLTPSGHQYPRPEVGSRYPLHVTAVGLVLLAHAEPAVQEKYLDQPWRRFTPHTETDPRTIRRLLADIRTHRFAIADRQVNPDAVSVAAPITDSEGAVVAALSVNVPVAQRHEHSLAQAVQTSASSISRFSATPTPAPARRRFWSTTANSRDTEDSSH